MYIERKKGTAWSSSPACRQTLAVGVSPVRRCSRTSNSLRSGARPSETSKVFNHAEKQTKG
ncbi:hypothetical protein [Bacillus pumilus]|uniref:hypothetical protein n=1 Tax=Bacillus pumilus TaxID=1408 RepID=UPI001E3A17C6|nr:hypothetical protein [Bacillus pumilus]MCC9088162.1 hypothetical protein [Bacillus pumilus]